MLDYSEYLQNRFGAQPETDQLAGVSQGIAGFPQGVSQGVPGLVDSAQVNTGILSAAPPQNNFLATVGNTPGMTTDPLSGGLAAFQNANPEQRQQFIANTQAGAQQLQQDMLRQKYGDYAASPTFEGFDTYLKRPDLTYADVKGAYGLLSGMQDLTPEQKTALSNFEQKLTGLEGSWNKYQGADPYQAATLYNQITSINKALDNKNWSGSWMSGGDNAAREAAIRLNRLGVDSLADLRVVPDYADATAVEFYRGQQVRRDESGSRYIFESRSAGDSEQLYPVYLPPDAKVEYYSATTKNVIDPSESYSETSYAPLTEEELKTFDPETKTYKVQTFDKLIDASTGQKIANMSMGPAGPAFYIDQYETGNFLKGKTKSFGIQIAPDGTPIPFTTTEKEGLVYSPILPFIASLLLPGVGSALSSGISGMLPGAAATGAGAVGAGAGIGFIPATAANTMFSNALASGLMSGGISSLTGGSFGKGFLGGALSPLASAGIGSLLPADMNPMLANTIKGTTGNMVNAAVRGGSVGDALKGGILGGALNYGLNQVLPKDMNPMLANTIRSTAGNVASAAAQDRSIKDALTSGILGGALNYGLQQAMPNTTIPPIATNMMSGIIAPALSGRSVTPYTLMNLLMQSGRTGALPYSQ